MKAGIISDTHDHHKNVLTAIDIFKENKVRYIFHAGDLVAPFTAAAFADVESAKFIAVFGNNDGDRLLLSEKIQEFGGQIHPYCFKGEVGGKKIYMTHTQHHIEEVAGSQRYDLVIYGHTHEQDIRKVGESLVLNPGESTDWITGSSYVILLELADMSYEVKKLG